MHMITRAVVSAGIVLGTVVSVAACAADGPTATGTDAGTGTSASTDRSTPTSTPTRSGAGTVDFGPAPDVSGAPACSSLLPEDLAAAVVPGARPVDLLGEAAHVAGTEAFLVAVGGASCTASDGVAPLDDQVPGRRGDPVFEGVQLTVLPAGLDALAEHREFDAVSALEGCSASDSARVYCATDARAGSAWVTLSATRLQDDADAVPERVQPAFDALLAAVVDRVSASSLGTADDDRADPDGSITRCDADNVNAVADTTLAVGPFPNSSTAPEPTDFARNRVGAESCVFVSDDQETGHVRTGAIYTHLPEGGWVAEQRIAAGAIDRSGRIDLDGLGAGDGAWRTCDERACSVDVVRDGDWTHWVLFTEDAADTATAIGSWVERSSRV
ncbi:hypothetical protein [Curtobacterium caseinilyticum]|uniref:DUF3558 domain-containing protein n=1 Tax=Curtobacterium caseinilyticum TaxID=3055137 RepID=A0ABT7TQ85_9MICO|nr:hypothetical protein [Curtobacterium caseinilyticum]MDM7891763.1 hypothetical protein [Curtobacterium caseinilyticum]